MRASLAYFLPLRAMPQYEVSSTHYFRETGQKIEAGDIVELTVEQADERNREHPGLLKPVRQTTQRRVTAVRVQPEVEPTTKSRKSKPTSRKRKARR